MIVEVKSGASARIINGTMYTSRSKASNGSKAHRSRVRCQALDIRR
ncbi:hypothetical protein JI435_419310 [Parastagonospora nodorum SN15]|uniref:Uncharacterized protein n=1 Tax=Phaeosphaeria nodorum (strain SN15 / ATCC MYA-4574 / FGSC 10173) TaxID=321614 RepID=A0A7U2FDG0_PHANO|nr:hypothetical protein JI435_419310 [Parastagonospora nodorum SN15]